MASKEVVAVLRQAANDVSSHRSVVSIEIDGVGLCTQISISLSSQTVGVCWESLIADERGLRVQPWQQDIPQSQLRRLAVRQREGPARR